MIKFEPHIIEVRRPLSFNDAGSILHNKANKEKAAELEETYKETHCPEHPGIESRMIVNVADNDYVLKVVSSCCPDFRLELNEIVRTHRVSKKPVAEKSIAQKPPERSLLKITNWIIGIILCLLLVYKFVINN